MLQHYDLTRRSARESKAPERFVSDHGPQVLSALPSADSPVEPGADLNSQYGAAGSSPLSDLSDTALSPAAKRQKLQDPAIPSPRQQDEAPVVASGSSALKIKVKAPKRPPPKPRASTRTRKSAAPKILLSDDEDDEDEGPPPRITTRGRRSKDPTPPDASQPVIESALTSSSTSVPLNLGPAQPALPPSSVSQHDALMAELGFDDDRQATVSATASTAAEPDSSVLAAASTLSDAASTLATPLPASAPLLTPPPPAPASLSQSPSSNRPSLSGLPSSKKKSADGHKSSTGKSDLAKMPSMKKKGAGLPKKDDAGGPSGTSSTAGTPLGAGSGGQKPPVGAGGRPTVSKPAPKVPGGAASLLAQLMKKKEQDAKSLSSKPSPSAPLKKPIGTTGERTKKPSTASAVPLISHAEKRAQLAEQRAKEYAEREKKAKEGGGFDLLEQGVLMTDFEGELVSYFKRRNVDEQKRYAGKYDFPRVNRLGAVFSLWPSTLPSSAAPRSADEGLSRDVAMGESGAAPSLVEASNDGGDIIMI